MSPEKVTSLITYSRSAKSIAAFALFANLIGLALLSNPAHALGWPGNNDNWFPSAPAAKSDIDFDGKGFIIHGKRVFIVAGDLHYSRVPPALWRDRLLRIKRAGYNTIQTYVFWNFHEPKEGVYNFSGDRDLRAYLKLIQSLGMYAIVRVGPYVNAEWDSGGWPIWLRFKPGLSVRDDNKPFYDAMDPWLEHLMPIVSSEQINHGGPIILVQLENEDTRGAGTDLPNPYFIHLKDKCVSLGLQVPYCFSGTNHGDDPAGNAPLSNAARTTPWYSTEFWTGWIRFYGDTPDRAAHLIRATWKLLAYGGTGYSHYTMAGGSNFDNWACSEQGANYDFGAPIGQAGDFREAYYGLKLASNFATSFQSILDDSDDSSDKYQNTAPNVTISARTAPAGSIVFLDNQQGTAVQTRIKAADGQSYPVDGPLNIAPNEIVPVVEDYPVFPHLTLKVDAARTLQLIGTDNASTLVVYGPPGDSGELVFATTDKALRTEGGSYTPHGWGWATGSGSADLKVVFSDQKPAIYTLYSGKQRLRIVAESAFLAQRTYNVNVGNDDYMVCGPDYVGQTENNNGNLIFHTEQATDPASPPTQDWLIAGSGQPSLLTADPSKNTVTSKAPRVPVLSAWSVADGNTQAAPAFDDAHWFSSPAPEPMGADGSESSYAWYRASVNSDIVGDYAIDIADAGDWVSAFVDGKHQSSSNVSQRFDSAQPRSLSVHVHVGVNHIAFLTSHYGRSKIHAYVGPIDVQDRKGIYGPITLMFHPDVTDNITTFREKADDNGQKDADQMTAHGLDVSGADWKDVAIGTDVFNGHVGYAWFRATLPNLPAPGRYIKLAYVDDNGFVYVNGKLVVSSQGYGVPFGANIDSAWNPNGPNDLAVLVQNTNGGGGIYGPVTVDGPAVGGKTDIANWKMQGGLTVPSGRDWKPVDPKMVADGSPRFYQATFDLPRDTGAGIHPVLRFSPDGLSRGTIYLNGHNLGRYPELTIGLGIFFPESYMHEGKNTITLFDEDGASPLSAKIIEETAATRTDVVLTSSF